MSPKQAISQRFSLSLHAPYKNGQDFLAWSFFSYYPRVSMGLKAASLADG
jgi:hypothetical protein